MTDHFSPEDYHGYADLSCDDDNRHESRDVQKNVHRAAVVQTSTAAMNGGPGAFEAELRYLAADLQELARNAPAHKRHSVVAISRLLRTLATNM